MCLLEWWELPHHRELEITKGHPVATVDVDRGLDLVLDIGETALMVATARDPLGDRIPWTLDYDWSNTAPVDYEVQPGAENSVMVTGVAEGEGYITANICGVEGSARVIVRDSGTDVLADFEVPANEPNGFTCPALPAGQRCRIYVTGTYVSERGSEAFINPPPGATAWEYDASWGRRIGDEWGAHTNFGELWIQRPGGYAGSPGWIPIDGQDGFSPSHQYEAFFYPRFTS